MSLSMKKSSARLLLGLVFASWMLPLPAAAYIDPVSGSVILQVLAAGLLAATFTFKRFWLQVRSSIGNILARFTRR